MALSSSANKAGPLECKQSAILQLIRRLTFLVMTVLDSCVVPPFQMMPPGSLTYRHSFANTAPPLALPPDFLYVPNFPASMPAYPAVIDIFGSSATPIGLTPTYFGMAADRDGTDNLCFNDGVEDDLVWSMEAPPLSLSSYRFPMPVPSYPSTLRVFCEETASSKDDFETSISSHVPSPTSLSILTHRRASICQASLSRISPLQNLTKKRYKHACKQCFQSFTRAHDLRRHVAIHAAGRSSLLNLHIED